MFGVIHQHKFAVNTLATLKSIRAKRPDGAPIYASWANPIEAHFGPLRTFVIAGLDHQNHVALSRHLHQYLRWRYANARHPDVLTTQRARVRNKRQHRWDHPAAQAA